MSRYWAQKVVMGGPGCEPPHIASLMSALRPHAYGMTLCGAGGGGFLALLARESLPSSQETLQPIVDNLRPDGAGSILTVEVAARGLVVTECAAAAADEQGAQCVVGATDLQE
jgi:fucokinase